LSLGVCFGMINM